MDLLETTQAGTTVCQDCGGTPCADTCGSQLAELRELAELTWTSCCPTPQVAAARYCGCGGHPYL